MSKPAFRITGHARSEAERRGISLDILQEVIEHPGQVLETHSERKVYQSKIEIDNKLYVVRAIVEVSDSLTVITVYRTSKVEKYWSDES
jgi:hypothetical protein